MAFSFEPNIDQTIVAAAQRYGLDPNAMRAIAHIESRGNPNARNPNSSAGGLYQFIDSTAKQYGLENKFDPIQAADAGARLARDNANALRNTLGREPTAGELYLAHQQGVGGARKLLSNPQARAADVVGADAVRLNGGDMNMTAGEFARQWTNKADSFVGAPFTGSGMSSGESSQGGMISNDAFMSAFNRVRGGQAAGMGAPQQPQELTTQDRLAGLGAALVSLDQGGGAQTQDLAQILQQARQMPTFNRRKGLAL